MAIPRSTKYEWTLWVVAASCAVHAAEEYFTGWQEWAQQSLGISVPPTLFLGANAVLVMVALLTARLGWRRPTISLIVPSATLLNAVFLHILPSILQARLAPGIFSATLLYLPFSSWALAGAIRDGVPRGEITIAFFGGTAMLASVVLTARALSIANLGG